MTKFRRIVILVFILSMMLGVAGCEGSSNTADEGLFVVDGQYLVNDGASEYKIVIPGESSNLYCMLAPIRMDYYKPITDSANQEYYNNLKAWGDMAQGNLYLWYQCCTDRVL